MKTKLKNNGWYSVNDFLPNTGETVLVYIKEISYLSSRVQISPYTKYGFENSPNVTHWKRLPEPPVKFNL